MEASNTKQENSPVQVEQTVQSSTPNRTKYLIPAIFLLIVIGITIRILYGYFPIQKPKESFESIQRNLNPTKSGTDLKNPVMSPEPNQSQAEKNCYEPFFYAYFIRESEINGFCELTSAKGYYEESGISFLYPSSWNTGSIGAAGNNAGFSNKQKNDERELAMYITFTEIPLEQSEKSIYYYESSQTPIVKDTEFIVSKEIKTIGNNKTLYLKTVQEKTTIHRYFLIHHTGKSDTLYVFETKKENISDVEKLISSVRFISDK